MSISRLQGSRKAFESRFRGNRATPALNPGFGETGLRLLGVTYKSPPDLLNSLSNHACRHISIYLITILVLICSTHLSSAEENYGVTKLSSLLTGRNVQDICVSNGFAFCADWYGLSVWNISDDGQTIEVARKPTPGRSFAVATQGDIAYIGDMFNGLLVYDVTDPVNPITICEMQIDQINGWFVNNLKLVIQDTILYYCLPNELIVFSIRDRLNPAILDRFSTRDANFTDLVVRGDIAYLLNSVPSQIYILDLSDPTNLRLTDVTQYDTYLISGALHDSLLIMTTDFGVSLLSLEDPIHPNTISNIRLNNAKDILIRDSLAFITGREFTVVNFANPQEAQILGQIEDVECYSIDIWNSTIYLAGLSKGVLAINVNDPTHPVSLNESMLEHNITSICYSEDRLFAQDLPQGSIIIGIHIPTSPGIISTWTRNNRRFNNFVLLDILQHDNYIYTGERNSLAIINIEDINDPHLDTLLSVRPGNSTFAISETIIGDNLYLLGRTRDQENRFANMTIFDVSQPARPRLVRQIYDAGSGLNYYAQKDSLIMQVVKNNPGDEESFIIVYNVSEPENPRTIGQWDQGKYGAVELSGNYLYAIEDDSLCVYNVDNPVEPEPVHSIKLTSTISLITHDNEVLYLGGGQSGVYCISIQNPNTMDMIGYFDSPGYVNDIYGKDGYLYVADQFELGVYDCAELHGIWNLQVSETSHDFQEVTLDSIQIWSLIVTNLARQELTILTITTDSAAFHIEFDDSLTLMPDEEASLDVQFTPNIIRDYSGTLIIHTARRDVRVGLKGHGVPLSINGKPKMPTEFTFYPPFPNPFNSATKMQYELPELTHVRLTIYDLSGRELIKLIDRQQEAGIHCVNWGGTNKQISPAPTGVYLARLEAGSFVKTSKIMLLR